MNCKYFLIKTPSKDKGNHNGKRAYTQSRNINIHAGLEFRNILGGQANIDGLRRCHAFLDFGLYTRFILNRPLDGSYTNHGDSNGH